MACSVGGSAICQDKHTVNHVAFAASFMQALRKMHLASLVLFRYVDVVASINAGAGLELEADESMDLPSPVLDAFWHIGARCDINSM